MPDPGLNMQIGVGTAAFIPGYGLHSGGEQSASAALIEEALDRNIVYFDTAPVYGEAEIQLGLVLQSVRHHPRICTKAFHEPSAPRTAMADSLRKSLERLQLSKVDSVLVHNTTEESLNGSSLRSQLEYCREQGLCHKIGVSTYGGACARLAAQAGWCEILQFEFSLLNPSVLPFILPYRREKQEWIARSVLCKGLLTDKGYLGARSPELRALLPRIKTAADERKLSLEKLAYLFVLNTPDIDLLLAGPRNQEELLVLIEAHSAPPLAAEEMAFLGSFDASNCVESHPEKW